MEGILPNNLLQIESHGFMVVPPDPYGNRQRVFVPRAALLGVEVLGVVGSPLKKRKAKADAERADRSVRRAVRDAENCKYAILDFNTN